jgi:glycosyltransferase involved in cell wall biosynthesis
MNLNQDLKVKMSTPVLTVAIPTWNRATRLQELLSILSQQLEKDKLGDCVELFVSDNGSTDSTPDVCREFADCVRSARHSENIGFDANCWSCYQQARGQYVLWFSDDDIPDDHLLQTISRLVKEYQPAAMLYSFLQQPYTVESPTIDIETDLQLTTEVGYALRYLVKYGKMTTYCVRKQDWSQAETRELLDRIGTGYLFMALAVWTFLKEPERGILLHRVPLAKCREDYNVGYRMDPWVWANQGPAVDIGPFHAVAPSDLLRSLKRDPLWMTLVHLRDHYLGILTFEKENLERGEQFLRQNRRQLLTFSRVFLTLEYLTAKHVKQHWLRSTLMKVIFVIRPIMSKIRSVGKRIRFAF